MAEGRHFKSKDEGATPSQGVPVPGRMRGSAAGAPGAGTAGTGPVPAQAAGQRAAGPVPGSHAQAPGGDASPAHPSAGAGAQAGAPGPAPRPAGGASQDTFQFVALANSRPNSGRRTPGAPADRPSGPASARPVQRIETEGAGGPRNGGPASSSAPHPHEAQKAEFYDFNIPYGEDGDSRVEGDLVRHRHRRGEKRRRRVVIAIVAVLVALVIAAGAGGFALYRSAQSVQDQARSALSLVSGIQGKVTSGDFASLPDDVRQVDELCASIQDEVSSPLWTAATFIPVVGGDVDAARTLVDVLADVSSGALVPIADNLAEATPGKLLQDGTINVSAVQALADSVAGSAAVLDDANERVQAIGDTHISQVTELVDTAKSGFAALSGAVDAAEKVAPVLSQMLGAGGQTRTYLIVAENNAEIRALGGFSGAAGILTVTDGTIDLQEFESTQTLRNSGGPTDQIQISDEEMLLFQPDGETLNFTAGDSFFVPDFPRGSELTRTIWAINHDGQTVDGVFAIDPVFLQYMLQLVGGVTAIDGTQVDGTNAAQVLLSDVYWHYPTDGQMQDAVFASVASAAFDKLVGGLGDLDFAQLIEAVGRGASEGRLLIWMADEAEETAIREVGVDGSLPTDPADPETGVYVNNYSYSKLDWYLDLNVEKSSGIKSGDGSVTYSMKVTLTNTMTEEEAQNLPAYVQAHNSRLQPSEELLRLYLYAPAGGTISDATASKDSLSEATHNGLQVLYYDVRLLPGETYEVTYTVTVPAEGGDRELEVRSTPTAQEARQGTV